MARAAGRALLPRPAGRRPGGGRPPPAWASWSWRRSTPGPAGWWWGAAARPPPTAGGGGRGHRDAPAASAGAELVVASDVRTPVPSGGRRSSARRREPPRPRWPSSGPGSRTWPTATGDDFGVDVDHPARRRSGRGAGRRAGRPRGAPGARFRPGGRPGRPGPIGSAGPTWWSPARATSTRRRSTARWSAGCSAGRRPVPVLCVVGDADPGAAAPASRRRAGVEVVSLTRLAGTARARREVVPLVAEVVTGTWPVTAPERAAPVLAGARPSCPGARRVGHAAGPRGARGRAPAWTVPGSVRATTDREDTNGTARRQGRDRHRRRPGHRARGGAAAGRRGRDRHRQRRRRLAAGTGRRPRTPPRRWSTPSPRPAARPR